MAMTAIKITAIATPTMIPAFCKEPLREGPSEAKIETLLESIPVDAHRP